MHWNWHKKSHPKVADFQSTIRGVVRRKVKTGLGGTSIIRRFVLFRRKVKTGGISILFVASYFEVRTSVVPSVPP